MNNNIFAIKDTPQPQTVAAEKKAPKEDTAAAGYWDYLDSVQLCLWTQEKDRELVKEYAAIRVDQQMTQAKAVALKKTLAQLEGNEDASNPVRREFLLNEQRLSDCENRLIACDAQVEDFSLTCDQYLAADKAVTGWLYGSSLPPLEERSVVFSGEVCAQIQGNNRKDLFLIGAPTVFCYQRDGWQEEGAVELISAIWRGFTKTIPERLLDLSVVDPDRMVSGKIGSVSRTRMDFARSYQDGFAEMEGADPVRSRIRGLFTAADITRLDQELAAQQRAIQSYDKEHFLSILDAPQLKKYGDPDRMSPISRVNLYTFSHDKPPLLHPYHVVIFVVPRQQRDGGYHSWPDIDYMANLIRSGNTKDFGLLPVFLASEQEQSER